MDNIIKFPNKNNLPNTIEEAQDRLTEVRTEFVNEVLEDVTERLFNDISNYGFTLSSEDPHYKDIFFVTESIQALLMRYAGIQHHLHPIIDATVEVTRPDTVTKDGEEILAVAKEED